MIHGSSNIKLTYGMFSQSMADSPWNILYTNMLGVQSTDIITFYWQLLFIALSCTSVPLCKFKPETFRIVNLYANPSVQLLINQQFWKSAYNKPYIMSNGAITRSFIKFLRLRRRLHGHQLWLQNLWLWLISHFAFVSWLLEFWHPHSVAYDAKEMAYRIQRHSGSHL